MKNLNVVDLLKLFGLGFSGFLTVSLFLRLFKTDIYGWAMALLALALFELGALGWSEEITKAQGGQRPVVYVAMWFCVFASLASSGSEIIMATNLYKPDFDLNLITLLVIIAALVVNVGGSLLYRMNAPELVEENDKNDREALYAASERRKIDRLTREAIRTSDKMFDQQKQTIAVELSAMRVDAALDEIAKAHGMKRTGKKIPSKKGVPDSDDEIDRYFDMPEHEITVVSGNGNGNGHKPDPKASATKN